VCPISVSGVINILRAIFLLKKILTQQNYMIGCLWLIGAMWLLPFLNYYHFYPLTSFYSEWAAFVLGLAAMGILVARRFWEGFSIPQITAAPLGLFVVLLLQIVFNKVTYTEEILLAAPYLLWAAALMWLGGILRREFGWQKICTVLSWFLLIGGLLNALAGIIQHYQIHSFFSFLVAAKVSVAVYGNLAQANHFANYIALALASAAYLFANKKLPIVYFVLIAASFLFVMGLSGSRSTWIYLVVFMMLAGWLYYRQRNTAHKTLALCFTLLIPLFMLVQLLAQTSWLTPASALQATPNQRLFELTMGGSTRLWLWQHAWLMFLNSPILGVGFGEFAWYFFQQSTLLDNNGVTGLDNNSHNLVMQLLATTGVLGTFCIVAGAVVWIWRSRKLELTLEKWWLFALLAVLAIHSMFEYPLWYAHFLGIAAILLGAGDTHWFRLQLTNLTRWSFMLMLVMGWISAFSLLDSYIKLEGWLYSRKYIREDSPETGRLQREALLKIRRQSLLGPYVDLAYTSLIVPSAPNLTEKIALNEKVMHFAPVSTVVYRQVLLLTANRDEQAAAIQLDRAARLYPESLPQFSKNVDIIAKQDKIFAPLAEKIRLKLQEK
jgi:O-antigen ligase